MNRLAILGAGAWGTALSIVLSRGSRPVALWVHNGELAAQMRSTRENTSYLPGFPVPATVAVTSELGEALTDAELIVIAVPSHHLRSVMKAAKPHLSTRGVVISATKGIEIGSLLRMTQVIAESVPHNATLSGPAFAREVAAGQPAAVVIASTDATLARHIQADFSGPTLRLYTNDDVAGVEYASALKNVIAIAAGVCDGLRLGSNSLAALITRGLAEITRLACACGARRETLAGLAGLGDLVLTCTGALSRNRSLGVELARGRTLDDVLATTRTVAEGVNTTLAAMELAHRASVEIPIAEQMHALLFERRSPQDAIRQLMERSLKSE